MVNLLAPGELERSRKVYQQLGLRDFAASDEIKRAYRELALLHHPDKNPNDPDAINRFRLINEAYQILSDETKRKRYDTALQSAQAVAMLYPNSSARHAGATATMSAAAADDASSNSFFAGGFSSSSSPAQPPSAPPPHRTVPTPQQFREQMNNIPKRRHPPATPTVQTSSSNSRDNFFPNNNHNNNNNNNNPQQQPFPSSAVPGSSFDFASATDLNEEYRRKEKARFAEMKRRLETERAQQQEAEFQKLQKQQNDRSREQQRRQREQERIKEKLDRALQQQQHGSGPSSSASLSASTGGGLQLQSAPFQRVSSSTNQAPTSLNNGTPLFRAASSNSRTTGNVFGSGGGGGGVTNNKSINTPTYLHHSHHHHHQQQDSSPPQSTAGAGGNYYYYNSNLSATRSRSANTATNDHSINNNNNLPNSFAPADMLFGGASFSHSHTKHSTFATSFGTRRSMSPLGSPTGNTASRLNKENHKTTATNKDNHNHNETTTTTTTFASSASRRRQTDPESQHQQTTTMTSPLIFSSSSSSSPSSSSPLLAGSPDVVALARRRIEKDIENLPVEEAEEREHFIKLQERHERALSISRFKQEAITIEVTLRFRGLFDDETTKRFKIDCEEVVERSAFNVEYQCVIERESLLREASRIAHGLYAWHENIWAHMRANLSRQHLLHERQQLQRTAVLEEEESKDFRRLQLYGLMLNGKFRIASSLDEGATRSQLCQQFYNGAKAIEASRKFIQHHASTMPKEEGLARERLSIEVGEIVARGKLASAHAEECAVAAHARTTAIAAYINSLNAAILETKEKVANHNAIVGGLQQAIEMHKKDNARERQEHEDQVILLRGDIEGLESQASKLRKDLLAAEAKVVEENEKYKRLEDDKKLIEKKLMDVRATVRLEYESELKAVRDEAKEREAHQKKELEQEKDKYTALYEQFEKLRRKHTEAAEFLKSMVDRDAENKSEIERLRREVKMLRQLNDVEDDGNGGGKEKQVLDYRNDDDDDDDDDDDHRRSKQQQQQRDQEQLVHDTSNNRLQSRVPRISSNQNMYENQSERSGSQISVFEVQQPQEQQHQQSGSSAPINSNVNNNSNNNNNINNDNNSSYSKPSTAAAALTSPRGKTQQPQQQQQQLQQQTGPGVRRPVNSSATNNNNSTIAASSTPSSSSAPPGLNQTPASRLASSSTKVRPVTQLQRDQRDQQHLQLSPESSLANRHTRTAKLEQRLYTAAAAASAASVAMAQRESATNSSSSSAARQRLLTPATATPAKLPSDPTTATTEKTPPRQQQQHQQYPLSSNAKSTPPSLSRFSHSHTTTTTSASLPVGRPPLSPPASAKSSSSSSSWTSNANTPRPNTSDSNNNNNSNNAKPDPKASYRELTAQARPRALRQAAEWEEDDAAAVAQREAVAAFLQKQAGSISTGFTDDPRQAPLTVRSPVPGKGILEYAGINSISNNNVIHNNNSNNNIGGASGDGCTSCDLNKEAVSKLVSTSDKLLLRNASLVDDNETLAYAVVAMNALREKRAS